MAAYNITLLNSPPAPVVMGSQASGLNYAGVVVGGAFIPGTRAAYWNPGPALLPLIGQQSWAYGVNDFGDIVGTWGNNIFPGQAFLFRNGMIQDLASAFSNPEESLANDINNAGMVAAWAGKIGSPHAYRYDSKSGIATDLGVLPGHTESIAEAINEKGQLTGISSKSGSPQDPHAFLWDGSLIDLGPATYANDINDSGAIVGGRVVGAASTWTAYVCQTSSGSPQFEDLGALPLPGFVGSEAMGINNHGDIVGHSFTDFGAGQKIRAFVRLAGGPVQDLTTLIPANSGWLLNWALAINENGQIAGTGTYQGEYQAYLLTPVSVSPFDKLRYFASIDPMALILPDRIYVIWAEAHHPHVPKVSEIQEVLRSMTPEERRIAVNKARELGDYGKAFDEAIATMKR